MSEPVIVAAARTPTGRAYKGSLVTARPDDLLALVVESLFAQVPALDRATVEDVVVGTASPRGEQGHNLARITALLAEMPDVPGTTVNRYCASSLQAIRMAAHAIRCDEGGAPPWTPVPGLPDAYVAMGQTAENVAQLCGVSRAEMDEFALTSQTRAAKAVADGFFEREITPVVLATGRW